MILAGRPLVAAALLGEGPAPAAPLRLRLARSWHVFAIAYLIVVWALWAASIVTRGPSSIWSAVASVLLAAALPLLDQAFGRGLVQLLGSDAAAAPARRRTIAVVQNTFRVLLVAMALVLLPSFWGIDVLRLIGAPGAGVFSHALFNILVTTLLAYVVWQLAETALERGLGDGAAGATPNARARTLRPLLRKFVLGVLAVVWVMIALSAVGIDIGPLLAGAGVVGLAIGFGAQTLVKDIISGMFFLLDDAFRVGEYIISGSYKGTVESFSLRSIKLRHHRGYLFTVPFGELGAIENMSRDWVIDKISVSVTYDTDLDQVKKIIKQIGKELQADPEFAPHILQTLKMQGVEQFGDFAIQIRLKMMTKPGEQFVIRRRAYAMIKKAFDANGIEFAFPTVTVAGGGEPTAAIAQKGLELVQPPAPAASD
jgi:small-conductance mechanosensitive channel